MPLATFLSVYTIRSLQYNYLLSKTPRNFIQSTFVTSLSFISNLVRKCRRSSVLENKENINIPLRQGYTAVTPKKLFFNKDVSNWYRKILFVAASSLRMNCKIS